MRRLRDDRGNVVIVTAVAMTMLFGFLALVVDLGASVVRRSTLQNGADAAALGIAQACAEEVVSGALTCSTSLAQGFFDGNALGSTVQVGVPVLQRSHGGRVGRITVTGTSTEQNVVAPVLGLGGTRTVRATATARWGPLTAEDAVFPLAVCKGALPAVGGQATFIVDPANPGVPQECDGNDDAQPYGWLAPDDPAACTSKVTVLPSTTLSVSAPDALPGGIGCRNAIDDLVSDIRATRRGWGWGHAGSADDRTRVVAVYDAGSGTSGQHPSYSLVAIEFNGIRIGPATNQEANGDPDSEVCDPSKVCVQGYVRNWTPPTDGPIIDPALAALPFIDDSTVLDIRLVD